MSEVRIVARNIGKLYGKRWHISRNLVARSMFYGIFGLKPKPKEGEDTFWALRDVNLEIEHGEAVALIGDNAAGKSTLLKVLTGTLIPDGGEVEVNGSIAKLIALSTGYRADLSGRENIYLAGALRGYRKQKMNEIIDEIIAFSELGEFIEAPFGSYSAGMKMRLAFSVASHTEPDILFIDEALAVGDIQFRNKCLGRLQSIKDKTTFILVTHSMNAVLDFCDRTIVLEAGRVVFDGDSKTAVNFYRNKSTLDTHKSVAGPEMTNPAKVEISDAAWHSSSEQADTSATPERSRFQVNVHVKADISRLLLSLMLYDSEGTEIASLADAGHPGFQNVKAGTTLNVEALAHTENLARRTFYVALAIRDDAELIHRSAVPELNLTDPNGRSWGVIGMKSKWDVRACPPAQPKQEPDYSDEQN